MLILISHPIFLKHDMPGHPETSERIRKALKIFKYEKATNGESHLGRVHTNRYIAQVKRASEESEDGFKFLDSGETYVCKHTYPAACYAVGATIKAAEYARQKKPAFALVRPPGHHAHPDWTNGFCVFNNIAIAAGYLASKKERVLILDIDMHRGDGTAECVALLNKDIENKIYYLSINQQGVFPGASIDEGNVHNIYLPSGTTEDDYIEALSTELHKAADDFKPTMIAISAGFDSFQKDKETHNHDLGCGLALTEKTIKELKKMISGLPYFAVLEGGYNPESVIEGVAAFMRNGGKKEKAKKVIDKPTKLKVTAKPKRPDKKKLKPKNKNKKKRRKS